MKKIFLIFILVLFVSALIYGESDTQLKINIAETMEEFSKAYLEFKPDPVSRQGVAVLEIENNSDDAKRAKIGELIRAYMEEAMDRSLIFVLTDRANIEKIIDEIKFSASGMVSDESTVEIGEITGTAALISGSVTEEGSDFRILLKLTSIESGEVLTATGFSLPKKELIDASTELEYGYVAANGIGLSVKPFYYIIDAPVFNNFNLVMIDLAVKYRISRNFMISGGLMSNILPMDNYRWDPAKYPSQWDVTFGELQPDLPVTFADYDTAVGQITGAPEITMFHVDFQYTLNFSPAFNIGINTGIVSALDPRLNVHYTSNSGLFFNDGSINPGGDVESDLYQEDHNDIVYTFEELVGAKIEINPELFITHRFAISGTIGYVFTFPAVLRSAEASEGTWEFYDESVQSGFSDFVFEKYFGFDPSIMPDGSPWTIDMSGLYAGLCISVFF